MQLKVFYPSPALEPFIVSYQFHEFKASELSPILLKDFPRTSMDMVFCFNGQVQLNLIDQPIFNLSQCAFVGHFDQPYQINIAQDSAFLHVKFKPNGIYPLTKIALTEVLNKEISISDLMCNQMNSVYDLMQDQVDILDKIKILESHLLDQYRKCQLHYRLDAGINIVRERKGLITIKELSDLLNTNYKSLDRWFSKNVGLSPKQFTKITRFKNILEELEIDKNPDWMNIVDRYGYHDQAHFIKEFKGFSGLSPTAFIQENQLSV